MRPRRSDFSPMTLGRGMALSLAFGLSFTLPAAAQTAAPHRFHPTATHSATTHANHVSVGHLCPDCAAATPKRIPMGVMTAEQAKALKPPDCVACSMGVGDSVPPPGMAQVGGYADQSGYASVGLDAAPMSMSMMGMPTSEPVPIGVMRTSYANPASMAATAAPAAAPMTIPPPPTPMAYPTVNKTRMFGRMLGVPMPRFNSMSRAQLARERETHAAVRYDGAPAEAASLPASAVYGGGAR